MWIKIRGGNSSLRMLIMIIYTTYIFEQTVIRSSWFFQLTRSGREEWETKRETLVSVAALGRLWLCVCFSKRFPRKPCRSQLGLIPMRLTVLWEVGQVRWSQWVQSWDNFFSALSPSSTSWLFSITALGIVTSYGQWLDVVVKRPTRYLTFKSPILINVCVLRTILTYLIWYM